MEDGLPSSCGVSFLPALLQTTLIELQTKNRKNGFQDISKKLFLGGGGTSSPGAHVDGYIRYGICFEI